jgi:hypothetical protein
MGAGVESSKGEAFVRMREGERIEGAVHPRALVAYAALKHCSIPLVEGLRVRRSVVA